MTKAIFLTGGIGDFISLESHFPIRLKRKLETVYYATRAYKEITELFNAVPADYPNLKQHVPLWQTFWGYWAAKDKEEFETITSSLPITWASVEDWSISEKFPAIKKRRLKFQGSTLLTTPLADLPSLPPFFIVIHPDTVDWRPRRLNPAEWETIIKQLNSLKMPGVVIGTGNHPVPYDPQIINLMNRTTIPQAIEIVKRATGYVGIDSCFSILAAQKFPSTKLFIKSAAGHLLENRKVYYAPHKSFPFIKPSFV